MSGVRCRKIPYGACSRRLLGHTGPQPTTNYPYAAYTCLTTGRTNESNSVTGTERMGFTYTDRHYLFLGTAATSF